MKKLEVQVLGDLCDTLLFSLFLPFNFFLVSTLLILVFFHKDDDCKMIYWDVELSCGKQNERTTIESRAIIESYSDGALKGNLKQIGVEFDK